MKITIRGSAFNRWMPDALRRGFNWRGDGHKGNPNFGFRVAIRRFNMYRRFTSKGGCHVNHKPFIDPTFDNHGPGEGSRREKGFRVVV